MAKYCNRWIQAAGDGVVHEMTGHRKVVAWSLDRTCWTRPHCSFSFQVCLSPFLHTQLSFQEDRQAQYSTQQWQLQNLRLRPLHQQTAEACCGLLLFLVSYLCSSLSVQGSMCENTCLVEMTLQPLPLQ